MAMDFVSKSMEAVTKELFVLIQYMEIPCITFRDRCVMIKEVS